MNNKIIKIDENRLHHILGVARECYNISRLLGYNEKFCQKMFMIGWNHDVGYEFEEPKFHARKSGELIKLLGSYIYKDVLNSISNHGLKESKMVSEESQILNIADLLIDGKGNKVNSLQDRLEDIANRWGGKDTIQYKTAKEMVVKVLEFPLAKKLKIN